MSKATVTAIYTDFVDRLEAAGYFINDINPDVYEEEEGGEIPDTFIPLFDAAGGGLHDLCHPDEGASCLISHSIQSP